MDTDDTDTLCYFDDVSNVGLADETY